MAFQARGPKARGLLGCFGLGVRVLDESKAPDQQIPTDAQQAKPEALASLSPNNPS